MNPTLNPSIIVDEDLDNFDEMELLRSVRQSHLSDGLTIEEALSEGLLNIDDLPLKEEIENRTWTNEEIEALDSIEF